MIIIITMVNKKRGITDEISCPTMVIPGRTNYLLKIRSKRKKTLTPVPTNLNEKLYIGAITDSDLWHLCQ